MTEKYFILQPLESDDPEAPETALFSYDPDDDDRSWFDGAPFDKPPPEPIVVSTMGGALPDLKEVPLPMVSRRLAEALTNAGIDNIDYYEAEIHNESTGEIVQGYLAFNLIGVIAAADLAASDYEIHESPLISVDFDSLAIDASKARGALMFRLAECVTAIVIHESVKTALEVSGIDTLDYILPENFVG